jgi:hypothetical protein
MPVDGPPRCTLTMTQGISVMTAYPRASCIRENPGPLVAVMTLRPVSEAPMIAQIEAISSSIWMNLPPDLGSRDAKCSATSVDGVIG